MRDLNIDGSKRLIHRTADCRRIRPCHSPSTPRPMGVMAPMPVITTLRAVLMSPSCPRTLDHRFVPLYLPLDTQEGPRRNSVDENRPNDPACGYRPDQRPTRPVPFVNDG